MRTFNACGVQPLRVTLRCHFPIFDLPSVVVKDSVPSLSHARLVGLCMSMLAFACHRTADQSKPAVDGAILYASACARCHGADGCGGTVMGSASRARNFCESGFRASVSDAQIRQAITQGKGMMPSFDDDYNEEQLTALVRQIRKFGSGPTH
jgi:mono/diheme cytochrome c family protein